MQVGKSGQSRGGRGSKGGAATGKVSGLTVDFVV